MSISSTIEWTDATWNPVTGCVAVSPGCEHCYARTFAERWRGIKGHHFEQGFDLKLWPSRLDLPLRWSKPKRIFVNSMSDLFHRDIPVDFILDVFATMKQAHWHTFQVLTKRPSQLVRFVPRITAKLRSMGHSSELWPSNIWLGVSIETIQYKWRADQLRKVPADIRFVSAEPLLGSLRDLDLSGIKWLITGGESGPGFRPCEETWIKELRDNCQAADVAFFFKQWGGRTPSAGGRLLDGRTWDEYPAAIDDKPHNAYELTTPEPKVTMNKRSEAALKAWATRRKPTYKAGKSKEASKKALLQWCEDNGWRVIFFEGKSGAPRTGIVDAVMVRIKPSNADTVEMKFVQLKSGSSGLTGKETTRMKQAQKNASLEIVAALYDGDEVHFLPINGS